MSIPDLLLFASKALRGHRLRTGLSMLGVAIGVAAVVVLTSLGVGARDYVTDQFASLGTNILIVLPGKTETTGGLPGIGGVPRDLDRGCKLTDSDVFVCEGDEYDTAFFDKGPKFLHYHPHFLLLLNIEFDHADIFANLEEIKTSFRRLLNIVPENGMVLINGDDANCRAVASESG